VEAEPSFTLHPLSNLVWVGMLLIFIGFILVFLGFLAPVFSGGRVSGGGGAVVIIGPFPIVIASNERIARGLLLLAIVLVVLAFALFFLAPYILARGLKGVAGP